MKKSIALITALTLLAGLLSGCTSGGTSEGGEGPGGGDTHEHTYSKTWSHDETYHWHDATCGHDVVDGKAKHDFVTNVVEPTYDTTGYTTHTCSVCGYSFTDSVTDKLAHNFEERWTFDDNSHWHACLDAGYENLKKDEGAHDFDNWVIDEEATEYQEGSKHKSCSVCGYTVTETIDALPHTHKEDTPVRENVVEPTCTEEGHYDLVTYCLECGEELSRETKATGPLGHDYGEWKVTKAATCLENGVETRVCSRDATHIETREIDAFGHSWGDWVITTEPTCLDSGIETRTCDHDANHKETRVVDALGHDLIHHSAKAATCTEDGWGEYDYCSRCDYSTKVVIPATGHQHLATREENRVEATCTENGSYVLVTYCTDDDAVISRENKTIQALGHDLIHHDAQQVTCTEDGWEAYDTCSRCDYSTLSLIPATDHDWNEPTIVWSEDYSSCTATKTCKNDSAHVITETVKPYYRVIKSATYESEGKEGYTAYFREFNTQSIEVIVPIKSKFKYTLNADEVSYSVKADSQSVTGAIVIPTTYNDLPVTSISDDGFKYCSKITSVTISSSITSIGEHAFDGCEGLTSIVIPDNVTNIGLGTFQYCSNLESITLPYIGQSTSENQFFEYIFGDEQNASTQQFAPTTLQTVTLSDHCTYIPEHAFEGCGYVPSVILGSGVETIDDYAFNACSLTSITLSNNLTSIGERAFNYCTSLTAITIPNSVTSIGEYAFYYCSALETLNFGSGLTTIGDHAFENCESLTSIIVPDNVTSIGFSAFYGCRTLESITLPFIGGSVSEHRFLKYIFGSSSSYDMYGGTSIPSSLKTVTLSDNCTFIPFNAFYGCDKLETINIPDTVTSIADYAFYHCAATLVWGDNPSVSVIRKYGFANYDGESLIIPDSVDYFGDYVFDECNSLFYNEFDNAYYLGSESNPYAVLIKAKDTSIASCAINSNCRYIYDNAFRSCTALTSIIIPDSVKTIGLNAFYGCSYLASVKIGSGVNYIGSSAFYRCYNLGYNEYDNGLYLGNDSNPYAVLMQGKNTMITSCEIHENCRVIYESAFSNYDSLESVSVPNGLISINNYVFSDCTALQYNEYDNGLYLGNALNPYLILIKAKDTSIELIEIHENCKIIYMCAFEYCKSLTALTIPSKVIAIGGWNFSGCTSLTTITFENNNCVTGDRTFYGCSALVDIYFTGTIGEWNHINWDDDVIGMVVHCSDGDIQL